MLKESFKNRLSNLNYIRFNSLIDLRKIFESLTLAMQITEYLTTESPQPGLKEMLLSPGSSFASSSRMGKGVGGDDSKK